jgi:hypothetical protein
LANVKKTRHFQRYLTRFRSTTFYDKVTHFNGQPLDELTRGRLPHVVGNSQHRPSRIFARLGIAGRNTAASVIALAASSMNQGVAPSTQCNEIFFGVASTMASEFNVVNLQMLHAAARLTSPAVSPQNLPM